MSCQKLLQQVIGVALAMLFLVGCGAPAATSVSEAPAATSTPLPLVAAPTPEPPTATPTPIPPTATPTPVPPTATPTVAPIVTITGRVLYADSEEPVPDTMLMITDENGAITFGEGGVLLNPTANTDSSGGFTIEIPEAFLEEQDYQIMVAISLRMGMSFLTNAEGVNVLLEIEGVPSDIDLGDIYVQR